MSCLDAADLSTMADALARQDSVSGCAQRRVLAKLNFESAPEDAPLLLRRVLQRVVDLAARPMAYKPGQSIEYPRVAEIALVTGT